MTTHDSTITDDDVAAAPAAPAGTTEVLFVANTYGSDIWVLDGADHRHLRTIDVGGHPDEITIPSTGDVLYVPRRNRDDLVAIDIASGEQRWRVALSGNPHHTTITHDDRYVYAPIFNQPYLEVVDVEEQRVVARVPVGFGGHGSLITADGSRIYVGTMVHDQLCAIDTVTREVVQTYRFTEAVRPFALSPDESCMFVQLSKLHGFMAVDLATGVLLDEVRLPAPPSGSPVLALEWPHTVNHGLAVTPDGSYLLAAASLDRFVAVYSLPQLELVATVPVGDEPNWIVFDHAGERAYVSNRASDEVSVLALDRWREVERVKVGTYPQRMSIGHAAP